jgi:hypothetical protein
LYSIRRRFFLCEQLYDGLTLTSRARRGRFAVYGFAGEDGPAHLKHLPGLWMLYRLVPRA